jgi:hypothetical protein
MAGQRGGVDDGQRQSPSPEVSVKSLLARLLAAFAALLALAGCVVYEPVHTGGGPAATFDRAWNATLGAFQDQGVKVGVADRATGIIEGRKGGINVKARLMTQADSRIRVEINAGGALSEDPGLPDRVSRAYDARMGRY